MQMFRTRFTKAPAIAPIALSGLAFSLLASTAVAQEPETIFLQTSVGSFKILGAGDVPATGKVEITFTGTVLISELVGKVTAGPGVRLEINRPDRKKQVYFGKGKLIVEGKIRGLQFFGRDLNGKFTGTGILRLYGEFDRKLETGNFWYSNNPEKKPWGTGGMTVTVPGYKDGASPIQGKVKKVGGK